MLIWKKDVEKEKPRHVQVAICAAGLCHLQSWVCLVYCFSQAEAIFFHCMCFEWIKFVVFQRMITENMVCVEQSKPIRESVPNVWFEWVVHQNTCQVESILHAQSPNVSVSTLDRDKRGCCIHSAKNFLETSVDLFVRVHSANLMIDALKPYSMLSVYVLQAGPWEKPHQQHSVQGGLVNWICKDEMKCQYKSFVMPEHFELFILGTGFISPHSCLLIFRIVLHENGAGPCHNAQLQLSSVSLHSLASHLIPCVSNLLVTIPLWKIWYVNNEIHHK